MGEMTDFTALHTQIESGAVSEAAAFVVASPYRASAVTASFTSDALDAHAEKYASFAAIWHDAADVGERLHIADWVAGRMSLEWSHLDDQRLAAALLVDAAHATIAEIRRQARDAWVFADGPDAGISRGDAHLIAEAGEAVARVEWPTV